LIPRFYDIRHGTLKIDGVDHRMYPLHVLRQNVSVVLQDSVLFEGTVRENLEIGRPGAPLDDIVAAAKKANIHDVILSLPQGYETVVREQGSNFSAGQRQRLAIARAILRDSPILILDEPTANLDVEAEAEVMHALQTLIVGRTVLMISHRLSTLGQVDEIIVLHKGRIAEHGTYKELKAAGGAFAYLLAEQNRYNIVTVDRREERGRRVVRHVRQTLRPVRRPPYVVAPRAPSAHGRRPRSSHAVPVGVPAGGRGLDGHGLSTAAAGPDATVQRGFSEPDALSSRRF